ncbi:MAG: orotidine 5'-phosphate decarboxylase [Deltaproteobacteria bacterium]|nr:orotidine 5'-phosphate decarboxylase [Deltaproteobacteria bacterium]
MKKFAVIASLDLDLANRVLDVASRIAGTVDGIKIGVPTIIESGIGILGEIRALLGDKPLLVDLKIADIGFRSSQSWEGTNAKIVAKLAGSGASHITVHGFPGPSSVAEVVSIGRDLGIGVLLLPMMSHVGAESFFSGCLDILNFKTACEKSGVKLNLTAESMLKNVTDGILALGEAIGVDGYIGPATRPEDLLRYRIFTKKQIWCPGFGRQDRLGRTLAEQFKDWASNVGPQSAAIVGSLIYNAPDPCLAANEVVQIRDSVIGGLACQ